MHIKVEYPEAVINIREIKACIDAGDTIGEILERHLEENRSGYYKLRHLQSQV